MDNTLVRPCLADEGVFFQVNAGFNERECVISRNALAHLGRLCGHSTDYMNIYSVFEAKIHSVARRLVVAGESASPLILGAAYFIDVSLPTESGMQSNA